MNTTGYSGDTMTVGYRVRYPGDKDKIGSEVPPDQLTVGEEYLIEVSTLERQDKSKTRMQGEFLGREGVYSKFQNVGTYPTIGEGMIPGAMFNDGMTTYSSLLLPNKYGRGGKRSKTRRHRKSRRNRKSRRY